MAYIDFKELKRNVPIMDVVLWLKLPLKRAGNQWRGECPFCKRGGDRAFVVTPSEQSFCCQGACVPKRDQKAYGGDIIEMVAQFHDISAREAGERIHDAFYGNSSKNRSTVEKTVPTTQARQKNGLEPLKHLSFEHEALDAIGLSREVSEAIGVGVPTKGVIRNRIAIPIRLPDGTLCGYFGLAISPEQMPLLWTPSNLAEMIQAKPAPQQEEKPASDIRSFLRVVK